MKTRTYKHFILYGVCCFACFAASCNDDLGNYDYHLINEVDSIMINDKQQIAFGKAFTISPKLQFSVPESKDNFSYEWHLLSTKSSLHESIGLLGTERDLHIGDGPWIVKPIDREPTAKDTIRQSGTYTILYCVTNETTGVRYDKEFTIEAQNQTLNGYIMLCEDDDDSFDLEFVSVFNDTLTQYHDALDLFGSTIPRKGRKPIDLLCYGDLRSPDHNGSPNAGYRYALFILTDQSTDRLRVDDLAYDKTAYSIENRMAMMNSAYKPAAGQFVATQMISTARNDITTGQSNSFDYVLYNGNVFFYETNTFENFYTKPINRTGTPAVLPYLPPTTSAPYKVSPHIFSASHSAILFNEDANRFEVFNAGTMNLMYGNYMGQEFTFTQRLNAGTEFNWEDPAYRLTYLGVRNTPLGSYFGVVPEGFAIVKNVDTNGYELLEMTLANQSALTVTQIARLDFPAFPDGTTFEDIKFYAFTASPMPYLYMATDSKVYRVNTNAMSANPANAIQDVTNQVVPAGHKISMMKYTGVAPRFPRNNLVAMCTYDPSGTVGQNGQLAFYEVTDGTGELVLAKHPVQPTDNGYQVDMKWSGFGKIINVDYKEPTKRQ